ncbi:MAG: J domain-containing protein [Thermoanaerobaculia bacterium]
MKDPYSVLGIQRDATDAEIKKAYRRQARKSHPDVNPGDTGAQKRFQEIAAAYELLKDPERRQRFDRTGDTGDTPPHPSTYDSPTGAGSSPFGGAGNYGTGPRGGGFRWSGDFSDLFSEIFSGGGAPGSEAMPADEEDEDAAAPLTISFKDGVLGGTVSFRARIPRRCKRCGGSGRVGRSACPVCHGARAVVENEKLSVRIPAGVDTGSKIRIPGKGRSERGDLYLALTVEPHPYFNREGDDIISEVPITVSEAYLGAEIDVPTIAGRVRAKIPPGTAGGQRFRLKGRGVGNIRTGVSGDHYYRVTIAMPGKITEPGRAIAGSFSELYDKDPRAELPTGL